MTSAAIEQGVQRDVACCVRPQGDMVTEPGYCQLYRRVLPDRFPVNPRGEMATYQLPVVARREGEELVCDRLHDGRHIWPNGDEVKPEDDLLPRQ